MDNLIQDKAALFVCVPGRTCPTKAMSLVGVGGGIAGWEGRFGSGDDLFGFAMVFEIVVNFIRTLGLAVDGGNFAGFEPGL